jgi:hypothetical protein
MSHRSLWKPNCSGSGRPAFGRYKDVYISPQAIQHFLSRLTEHPTSGPHEQAFLGLSEDLGRLFLRAFLGRPTGLTSKPVVV